MRTRARIGITLLALAVAGALAYGFLPRPVPVDVAQVTQGPMAVMVEEEGKTRVMERYVVSAPIAGYARRIDLDVGDAVRPGQVVAAIEPARSTALDPRSRAQAAARVKAAEAGVAAIADHCAANSRAISTPNLSRKYAPSSLPVLSCRIISRMSS